MPPDIPALLGHVDPPRAARVDAADLPWVQSVLESEHVIYNSRFEIVHTDTGHTGQTLEIADVVGQQSRERTRGLRRQIYAILVNDLYTGHVKWNKNRYERDPDTKIHKCRPRPKSEWLTYRDE